MFFFSFFFSLVLGIAQPQETTKEIKIFFKHAKERYPNMLSFWWLCFYMTQKLVEDKFFQLHNFLWVRSTFWQGKSTHPRHNCPIYNRHPEICSKKTDFSCWRKHRLWGQNLKVSLLITCSAKFRIIPFKCHLMSTLSRKKVFYHSLSHYHWWYY